MRPAMYAALILFVALISVAGLAFVGTWFLIAPALWLLALVVQFAVRERTAANLALLFGLVGGSVCAFSAGWALLEVGGEPSYIERAIFAWFALLSGAGAALASTLAAARPRMAAAAMLVCSLAGCPLLNLFYININAWYLVGVLLVWVGAFVALSLGGRKSASGAG